MHSLFSMLIGEQILTSRRSVSNWWLDASFQTSKKLFDVRSLAQVYQVIQAAASGLSRPSFPTTLLVGPSSIRGSWDPAQNNFLLIISISIFSLFSLFPPLQSFLNPARRRSHSFFKFISIF
ncbi:hypothetical protein N431DRAFT_198158 [Stipitochalara longipes BDJ]|nr:hypothetical protein N431DRAFT_198158 [Stipitochalara longipes BDJ]